jgi:hypothetical protein
VELLAGGRYVLSLDPRRWIELELTAARPDGDGQVSLTATVRGAGEHDLAVRVFNGSVDGPQRHVVLASGQEQAVTWRLHVGCREKPWVAVVTPDGDAGARKEAFGTVLSLPAIAGEG